MGGTKNKLLWDTHKDTKKPVVLVVVLLRGYIYGARVLIEITSYTWLQKKIETQVVVSRKKTYHVDKNKKKKELS